MEKRDNIIRLFSLMLPTGASACFLQYEMTSEMFISLEVCPPK